MNYTSKYSAWLHFKRSSLNQIGLVLVLAGFVMALFAPLMANSNPLIASVDNKIYFPFLIQYPELKEVDWKEVMHQEESWLLWAPIPFSPSQYNLDEILQPPSLKHWLGTDDRGRDVAARLVYGTRVSLSVGFVAVSIYVLLGIILGALAGYFGGTFDLILSRITEVMMCFPTFFLILTVLAFVGPSIYNVMIVIGLTGWTGVSRLVRGEFLKLRETEYIHAAQVLGASWFRIIFKHLLPNALSPVFVTATFGVASAILTESALSFLGFGVQPPTPSWGDILSGSRDYIDFAWWLALAPGFALFVTITSYNLVGEGLRDALDPKRS